MMSQYVKQMALQLFLFIREMTNHSDRAKNFFRGGATAKLEIFFLIMDISLHILIFRCGYNEIFRISRSITSTKILRIKYDISKFEWECT